MWTLKYSTQYYIKIRGLTLMIRGYKIISSLSLWYKVHQNKTKRPFQYTQWYKHILISRYQMNSSLPCGGNTPYFICICPWGWGLSLIISFSKLQNVFARMCATFIRAKNIHLVLFHFPGWILFTSDMIALVLTKCLKSRKPECVCGINLISTAIIHEHSIL